MRDGCREGREQEGGMSVGGVKGKKGGGMEEIIKGGDI